MQLWGETDLGVDHAVCGEIGSSFASDPIERICGLKQGNRVAECVEVLEDVSGICPGSKVSNQFGFVGCR